MNEAPVRPDQRFRLRAAVIGCVALVGACLAGDRTTGPGRLPAAPLGLVVSDPVLPSAAAPVAGGAQHMASSMALGEEDSVVYVSLLPGTAPRGATATIRALVSGSTVTTAVQGGGFDPMPVAAQVGDSIETVVRDASGAVVLRARIAVARVRPPIVVRTDPPPKKRDVPLNAAMIVVFSEPIDPATLTGAVQLFQGTTSIGGRLGLRDPDNLTAVFKPDAPLRSGTDYQLVVTRGIHDLTGDSLEAAVAVGFTTEPPVASVSVSPDAAAIVIRDSVQLTAVARDSAGNKLADRPVTWASNDSGIASVAPSGLVRGGVRAGSALIVASVEGKADSAAIEVTLGAKLVFSVQPTTMSAGLRITPSVQVTARDALGNVITDYSGDVSMAIEASPAGGSLSGTTTVAAVAGVATFADLRIDASATGYTLVATASGVLAGTSRAFNITLVGPLSGRIAFARCQNPNCQSNTYDMDVFVANADGSGEARLTADTSANEDYPRWSPDGARIAYTSVTETASIFVVGADGSGVARLTVGQPLNHGDEDAVWSPDGTKLVFVSGRDGGGRYLYVMNADGSQPRRVPNQPGNEAYGPVWSPDGTKIAYAELETGVAPLYSIYVMNVDGSDLTRLTTPDDLEGSTWTPAWSPDGTKIAFTRNLRNPGIWIMAADGSGATQLPQDGSLTAAQSPVWSPDGTRIAFVALQVGNWDIYVMAADGSGVTRLTSDPGQDFNPAWGPAGSLPTPSATLRR